MGCHTWVSANRQTFDSNKVLERAKELYDIEIESLKKYKEINSTISEDILKLHIDVTVEYDKSLSNKKITPEEYTKNLSIILNRDKIYTEYIHYVTYLYYCNPNINYKSEFELHCTSLFENLINIDFEEQAFHDVTGIKDYSVFDTETGIYTLDTEFHDPFRVYGYPEEIFYTRERLEEFLFDKEVSNVMCIWAMVDENYVEIDKSQNYDLFVQEIKNKLDIIYEKYPDTIITFG
jgi:hypothetical protein